MAVGFSCRVAVPDVTTDVGTATAVRMSAESGSITRYASFKALGGVVVWVLIQHGGTPPTYQDVIDGGYPVDTDPWSIQPTSQEDTPDPADYWLAVANGGGAGSFAGIS